MEQTVRELAVEIARSHRDKPYKRGGNGPDTFDCSGLLCYILKQTGKLPIDYDDTAQGLYNRYKTYGSDPNPGCLVFYGKNSKNITHCALLVSSWAIIGANGGSIGKVSLEFIDYHSKQIIAVVDPYKE